MFTTSNPSSSSQFAGAATGLSPYGVVPAMALSSVSPYLNRPLRRLEDVCTKRKPDQAKDRGTTENAERNEQASQDKPRK